MRKILVAGGLTAAGVAAVIGVASTNSLGTVAAQDVGYTSSDINSPTTVSNVAYNVSQTADDVLSSVGITFAAQLPVNEKIQVGFGSNALVPCVDTNTDASGVVTTAASSFTCALTGQSVTGATKFRLLVTG